MPASGPTRYKRAVRRLLWIAAVWLLAVPAAGAAVREDVPTDAIAVVAGEPIPRSDFDNLIERARLAYAQEKQPFPRTGSPAYESLKHQAVAFLVTRVIYRQSAAALGIVITPEQVAARESDIVRDYFGGSLARFRRELVKEGLTENDLLREIEAQLVQETLYEHLTADVVVTDAEVEQHYAEHRADFAEPASRTVRHILVRTRALAVSLRARIVHGESFATLARRYSTDPGSRRAGGRLTVGQGQTVKAFDRVAFALKTGALSQPVHTQYGWHLIQALTAVRPGRTLPFEEVQERIEEFLRQERGAEEVARWADETMTAYASRIVYAPGFAP
jgi:parvulin-like peptidyl-prolyl isomerase